MKLEEKVGNVFLSDGLNVKNFNIKINRHSFRILYGDLYSRKIQAIVRELSTNAYDSHVALGKTEVPFEVHLPNTFEPTFYVQDFGIGLSPESVETTYVTFFDSNKTHSDEFTGCLGLGSKSPFAYTDNFTVVSNYNGMKYSYAAFMNAEGEPCIASLGSVETTEPNGLRIEFAVNPRDFEQFADVATDVLSWFKTRPNVIGRANFEFNEYKYLNKTDRFGVRKERSESNIIMGNVAYPINSSNFSYNKITDIERNVIDWGVDLFVDVGEAQFVPSREALSYTEKTLNCVKKYLKDAIASIQEHLELQVSQQSSVWKARKMLYEIKHSILGKVKPLDRVMYNGKEISDTINFKKFVEEIIPDSGAFCELISMKKKHFRKVNENLLHCNHTRIYHNDVGHGGFARVNNHLQNSGLTTAYMVTCVNDKFLEETGIGEVVINVSSLPVPVRAKRESKSYVKRTTVQQYCLDGGSSALSYWKDEDVELRGGGIYVVVSYGQIVGDSCKYFPWEIKQKYQAIKLLKPDFKLYGIRAAHIPKLEKYKKRWVKFNDFVMNTVKEELVNNKEEIYLNIQYSNLHQPRRYEQFRKEVFSDNSEFGKFVKFVLNSKKAHDNQRINAIVELGTIEVPSVDDKIISKTYPLWKHVNSYYADDSLIKDFSDYVRKIDKEGQ